MQTANEARGTGVPGWRHVLISVYAHGPVMGAEFGVGRELSRPTAEPGDTLENAQYQGVGRLVP